MCLYSTTPDIATFIYMYENENENSTSDKISHPSVIQARSWLLQAIEDFEKYGDGSECANSGESDLWGT